MKYKGIIFDLDGVICHTDKYHYQAWKKLADKLGIYFDQEINNRLRGVSRMESFDIILEKYHGQMSQEDKVRYAAEKNDLYRELLKNMTTDDLDPQVKETLDTLRSRGLLLAIGSSSKNAGFILERLGLDGYFDAVSDGNNISRSKPDPEVFLKAAEYLDLQPQDCLVVEDAQSGLEAAIAGNMDCAAIGDAVKCNKANYNLETFPDLLLAVGS
ncbi:beta-phosphoglucomutase [Blautia marasmi]|uniref:beta-phosphoglucomutase n=1 Tax=Blautia marasmi TaxID=1917868 RepID=UPI00266D1176|nr:beta-phosphoglucomutase [Blautia marasmi]